jgi:hypothetical protein
MSTFTELIPSGTELFLIHQSTTSDIDFIPWVLAAMSLVLKTLFLTASLTVTGLGCPGVAQAFTVTVPPVGTPPIGNNQSPADYGFENFLRSGQIQEIFVPGVRGGNNASSGEREVEILDDLNVTFSGSTAPGVINSSSQGPIIGGSGQRTWVSGQNNPFSLTYNPSATTDKIIFTSGGVTLKSNQFSTPMTELFLRTRAGAQVSAGTFTSSVSNLVLNGTSITNPLSSSCTQGAVVNSTNPACADVDYLRITGLNGGAFTLTGNSTFTWSAGSIPGTSRMMFQIKVMSPGPLAGSASAVPVPGMIAGMAFAGAGSLWKKLKGARQMAS